MPALYAQSRFSFGLGDGGRAQDDAVHQPEVELVILGDLDHNTCNIRAKRENWEEIKRELAIKRELLGRTNRQTQIVTPCQLLPWRIAVLQGYEPGSYRYWILPRVFGHHHHCLERLCILEEEHWKT